MYFLSLQLIDNQEFVFVKMIFSSGFRLKFRKWFKYGLKAAQKLLAQGSASKQHALKGQKLLAQGIALGIMPICKAPCKGKSFVYCPGF